MYGVHGEVYVSPTHGVSTPPLPECSSQKEDEEEEEGIVPQCIALLRGLRVLQINLEADAAAAASDRASQKNTPGRRLVPEHPSIAEIWVRYNRLFREACVVRNAMDAVVLPLRMGRSLAQWPFH
eukprot:RCo037952